MKQIHLRDRLLSGTNVLRQLMFLFMVVLCTSSAMAQKKVTGTIVDAAGEPIIGASVMVKGTSNGAVTDLDGNFTINNVPEDATLVFSYVGYRTQNLSARGKSNFQISLEEDKQLLDEVVVVGYGVQRKSDVTGALTRVNEEQLNNRPVSNAIEALQGKAAGVDITTSERPGTLGSIRIRGNRSINASNEPLYVVDGVPLSSGGIESLNSRDIESIDILKDASSTAIYGSRGANGVVLITTKRGKEGKLQLTYNGSVTFEKIVDKSPAMNAVTISHGAVGLTTTPVRPALPIPVATSLRWKTTGRFSLAMTLPGRISRKDGKVEVGTVRR